MAQHKNTQSTPRFSIVIPAYNEEAYIEQCLKSLAVQSFKGEYEVIVVDNNSTDNTAKLAKAAGVKVLFEPKRGVCAARQTGTEKARGEIIISTDADTIFNKTWLARIDRMFRANPEAVAVSGYCNFVDAPLWGVLVTKLLFGTVYGWYRLTGKAAYISACNLAFRKSAWSGYNTDLTQGGDELYLLKQLKQQGKIVVDPDNHVQTSSRRMYKGIIYCLVLNILLYYLLDYAIAKVTKHSFFGSYSPIREERSQLLRQRRMTSTIALLVIAIISGWYFWFRYTSLNASLNRRLDVVEREANRLRHRSLNMVR